MKAFETIYERAVKRKGGEEALAKLLPDNIMDKTALTETPNSRYLAAMTDAIFKAGFVWKVVENKWPAFEEAFFGFDISRCAYMTPEEQEAIANNAAIIRNRTKIKSVPENARMIIHAAQQYNGAFGAFIAHWPQDDYIGLLAYLQQHGSRLGGTSGQYFLRKMGKDGFILGRDGVAALIDAGVIDKAPTSKTAMRQVQQAYNQWHAETGFSFAKLSRVLALSIDAV